MKLSTSRSAADVLRHLEPTASALRRSASTANCVIVSKRGFKPSDRHDPHKREFLTSLTAKLLHISLDENSTDGSQQKTIDLEKLFTPASDSGEVTPSRHRKMYASSSFYSPHHPTVEDQVELARRISHSLSDISNQQSKGQSMYVNRKKKSVKWVHEGQGTAIGSSSGEYSENIEENLSFKIPNVGPQEMKFQQPSKPPLKLVMDPRGQVQDLISLRQQGYNIEPGAISPDICFDLVRDLNATKGKGAELFAKRRKKSEKWVVDENTVKMSSSGSVATDIVSSTSTLQRQTSIGGTSKLPPIVPSYLDSSRVQHAQKLNEIQERFTLPRLRLVKSPWEAALETGSVDAAFQEIKPLQPRGFVAAPPVAAMEPILTSSVDSFSTSAPQIPYQPSFAPSIPSPGINQSFNQRVLSSEKDFLYKPKAPRGWGPVSQQHPKEQTPHSTAPTYSYEPVVETPPQQQQQPPSARYSFTTLNNYNTAPRGWGQDLEYYRPVTFAPTRIG